MHWLRQVYLDLQGDKPVLTSPRDGDVLDRPIDGAALPEAHYADFRQIDTVALDTKALRIAKGIAQELFAIGRWLCTASKEIAVGAIQVFQTLLQHLRVNIGQPPVFFALLPQRQQSCGIVVRQPRDTRKIPTFVDRENLIPDKTTCTSKTDELLGSRMIGLQAVFIALAYLHDPIMQLVYEEFKRFSSKQALYFQAPCAFGLRYQIPQECVDGSCL